MYVAVFDETKCIFNVIAQGVIVYIQILTYDNIYTILLDEKDDTIVNDNLKEINNNSKETGQWVDALTPQICPHRR